MVRRTDSGFTPHKSAWVKRPQLVRAGDASAYAALSDLTTETFTR